MAPALFRKSAVMPIRVQHSFKPKGGLQRIPVFTGMTATRALYPTKARSIT